MLRREILLLLPAIFLANCDDDWDSRRRRRDCRDTSGDCPNEPDPNPTPSPTPTPEPEPKVNTVEYRVSGPGIATIVFVSSIDGTSEVTTRLPWVGSFKTDRDNLFLSISVFSDTEGTLIAQIFVNGELFREVVGDGFTGVSISGSFSLGISASEIEGQSIQLGRSVSPGQEH